jgi:hypothetical protein
MGRRQSERGVLPYRRTLGMLAISTINLSMLPLDEMSVIRATVALDHGNSHEDGDRRSSAMP